MRDTHTHTHTHTHTPTDISREKRGWVGVGGWGVGGQTTGLYTNRQGRR